MFNPNPFRLAPKLGFVLVLAAAAAASADTVQRRATVKNTPGSPSITSWWVTTPSRDVTVTAGGWTATRNANNPKLWHLTGGSTPPGGSVTANLTQRGGVGSTGGFVAFNYTDNNGKYHPYETEVDDPIAQTVVFGGSLGTSFLGYEIPANEYGYFFQQWAPLDAEHAIGTTQIRLGSHSDARNFAVLNNTFNHLPGPGMDLTDTDVPRLAPGEDTTWGASATMHEDAATGNPGVPTLWSFNPATGTATMDFSLAGGVGAGMTGSLVAFTSSFSPTFSESAGDVTGTYTDGTVYVSTEVVNNVGTPSPTPGALSLLAIGAACAARRRRTASPA